MLPYIDRGGNPAVNSVLQKVRSSLKEIIDAYNGVILIGIFITHPEYHCMPHPTHDYEVLPADELHLDVLRGLLPPPSSRKHV